MPGRRAVFLDRDGVITQEPPHYAHRVDQLEFIPRAQEAIRLLNQNGYLVIVVSNQSGIARRYYPEEDTIKFNRVMEKKLSEFGAHIDAMYYCPHHPNANCECRKPNPGMLIEAAKKFHIDFKRSFMIGDKLSDIDAGKRVGCKTILVLTGHGKDEPKTDKIDYTTHDLYSAVKYILRKQFSARYRL